MRRVEADGGYATVLRKGDPDSGALMLLLRSRGAVHALLERVMGDNFEYRWAVVEGAESKGSGEIERLIASRSRFDADAWLIELDIAQPERFIAETISSG